MAEHVLAGRHVLIVEDEYLVAVTLAEELTDQAVVVLGPASSVQRALAVIADAPQLDLALLDVNLGGEEVYPVADVLADRGIPFMLVTGYTRHAIPARYRQATILEKPIEMAAVVAALGRLVG